MDTKTQSSHQRLAKNTLMLYIRTIFVMLVSLFTSRVVLQALGIEDYGIYNVVGGVVAMFSVISGSLSSAISRFITYELGTGNKEKLVNIFSTSVNIQLCIGGIVLLLGETVGYWFLNYKMNIPPDRLFAANWVLHCSLLSFIINLISVPYNAAIIAHERMSAFAYVSILEVLLKLLIVYLLYLSPVDKLITYAILLVFVSTCIRFTYSIYCNTHFEETRYRRVHDKELVAEMSSFAGWSFLSNAGAVLNTQGINILINLFFGVTINAARGIATQVEHAVMQFVNNFTVAINPQIIKSYANNETRDLYRLICDGARYSFFLMLIICLPIIMETEEILEIWLEKVPDHTVNFIRLTFVGSLVNSIGLSGATACLATGKIKNYTIIISIVSLSLFPFTWVSYKFGAPVEFAYILFIVIYSIIDVVRLFLMKRMLGFPIMQFIYEVVYKIVIITCLAIIVPLLIRYMIDQSFTRLVLNACSCVIISSILIFLFGMWPKERSFILKKIIRKNDTK